MDANVAHKDGDIHTRQLGRIGLKLALILIDPSPIVIAGFILATQEREPLPRCGGDGRIPLVTV